VNSGHLIFKVAFYLDIYSKMDCKDLVFTSVIHNEFAVEGTFRLFLYCLLKV